jgi:hypothetical protein
VRGSTLVERFGDDDSAISPTQGCELTADDSTPNLAYRLKRSERIYIAMSAKSRRKELRRGQCLRSDGGGIEQVPVALKLQRVSKSCESGGADENLALT